MKFPCTLKNALLIIRDGSGLSFASKGLGYLAALFYYYRYLLVTNYLAIKLLCYLQFQHLQTLPCWKPLVSFPSAPRWARHSYLLKRATIDPIHLWVIKEKHEKVAPPVQSHQVLPPVLPQQGEEVFVPPPPIAESPKEKALVRESKIAAEGVQRSKNDDQSNDPVPSPSEKVIARDALCHSPRIWLQIVAQASMHHV